MIENLYIFSYFSGCACLFFRDRDAFHGIALESRV